MKAGYALPENEAVKTEAEQGRAANAERRADDREAMRVAADFADHAALDVELDGLLYLTVPHLSHAVEDHSERDQKRILVRRDGRRDGNRHTRDDQRNGPLAMIAQFLGIHRPKPPFAEIVTRFHLAEGGGFTQELILPLGWSVVTPLKTCELSSQLNLDLLRALLLHVEEKAVRPHSNLKNIQISGWTGERIAYHVALAKMAGLIKASITELPDEQNNGAMHIAYSVHRLTMNGHELLGAVRSERGWSAVKDSVRKVGIITCGAVAEAAKAHLKSEILRVMATGSERAPSR